MSKHAEFINLFSAFLRKRNILLSFDEFEGKEILSMRDFQDYSSRYQDLRDAWKPDPHEGKDIKDDVVFEIDLIRQIDINIDYILMLVKKFQGTHNQDMEVLSDIKKAIAASPELRSKKALIENFIAGINEIDDVLTEWNNYVAKQREADLVKIIEENKLKPEQTRKFMENAFRDGEVKTFGTDIDDLMPPLSRFNRGNRERKKQEIVDKFKAFFEKYFGVGTPASFI